MPLGQVSFSVPRSQDLSKILPKQFEAYSALGVSAAYVYSGILWASRNPKLRSCLNDYEECKITISHWAGDMTLIYAATIKIADLKFSLIAQERK